VSCCQYGGKKANRSGCPILSFRHVCLPLVVNLLFVRLGNRDLYFNGNKQSLKAISRIVKLAVNYQVTKTKKNKKVSEKYNCGAVKVKLTEKGVRIYG
jgi:predicted SpoU family rRNA methylase